MLVAGTLSVSALEGPVVLTCENPICLNDLGEPEEAQPVVLRRVLPGMWSCVYLHFEETTEVHTLLRIEVSCSSCVCSSGSDGFLTAGSG